MYLIPTSFSEVNLFRLHIEGEHVENQTSGRGRVRHTECVILNTYYTI